MKILVLNSGSSSQKACLYDLAGKLPDGPPRPLWEGKIEWRDDCAKLETRTASGAKIEQDLKRGERSEATAQLLQALRSGETRVLSQLSDIEVVGHRIVNGGRNSREPRHSSRQKSKRLSPRWRNLLLFTIVSNSEGLH